jgi:hypothetical protein
MTNTEADEINAKIAVILAREPGEYLIDFARGTTAVWHLIDWLHEENKRTKGMLHYLVGIDERGRGDATVYYDSKPQLHEIGRGDTANEALCRAIIAYAEAKDAQERENR